MGMLFFGSLPGFRSLRRGAARFGASGGPSVPAMFANETFRRPPGTIKGPIYGVAGSPANLNNDFELASGARATILDDGEVHFSPHGAYDHLGPGDTALEQIPYNIAPPTEGASLWSEANVVLGTGWTDNGGGSYSKTSGTTQRLQIRGLSLTPGTPVRFKFSAASSANTCGVWWANAGHTTIEKINPDGTGISGDGAYVWDTVVPEGAVDVHFVPNNLFSGTVEAMDLPQIVLGAEATYDILIKASEQVGPHLHDDGDLSGTNWAHSDGVYTHTPGSTAPLSMALPVAEGKVCQIACTMTGRTAGSVTPQIAGDGTNAADYELPADGREVWWIRVPAGSPVVDIVPTSDFDGGIGVVFIQEVLTSGAVPVPVLSAVGGTGEVTLRFDVPPASGYRSDNETPDFTVTGTLAETAEYGTRFNSGETTGRVLVADGAATARRDAVSIRCALEWLEVLRLSVVGGYSGASEAFQYGISDSDTEPVRQFIAYHGRIDLGLSPNGGDYGAQNSDCMVMNTNDDDRQWTTAGYVMGYRLEGASDGCLDTKKWTHANHVTMVGGHRTVRNHHAGHVHLHNFVLAQVQDSQSAIRQIGPRGYWQLWNGRVDGVRVVSATQLAALIPDVKSGGAFSGIGAYSSETGGSLENLWAAKSLPRIPSVARANMTDMEFEVSPAGEDSWQALDVPDVGLPGVLGAFERTVAMDPGDWKVRPRCRNGADTGAYGNTVTFTVS